VKLSVRMSLLIVVAGAGLLVSSLMSFGVLQKLKVNGPIYKEIVQGKDLAADILPPPEYIIESYLTLKVLQDETDLSRKQALIATLGRLKTEYETRHDLGTDVAGKRHQEHPGPGFQCCGDRFL
jgi:hypothetical protein